MADELTIAERKTCIHRGRNQLYSATCKNSKRNCNRCLHTIFSCSKKDGYVTFAVCDRDDVIANCVNCDECQPAKDANDEATDPFHGGVDPTLPSDD